MAIEKLKINCKTQK